MRRIHHGFTLAEALVVVGVVTLVSVSIGALFIRSSAVYARVSGRIEPQTSQLLALKQLEREIRTAYLIDGTVAKANSLTIYMPATTDDGLIDVGSKDLDAISTSDDNLLGINLGEKIQYTTVRETAAEGGINVYGNSRIDTYKLMRKVTRNGVTTTDPHPLLRHLIFREEDEEDPDNLKRVYLFEISPYKDNGTPNDPTDDTFGSDDAARLVKITLSCPYTESNAHGKKRRLHTLTTQFRLRNTEVAAGNSF